MTQKGDKRIQVQKLSGVAIKNDTPGAKPSSSDSSWREAYGASQLPGTWKAGILRTDRKKGFSANGSLWCVYLAAPREPPGNLRWEQQGSQVSLGWEPVRPLANESEVMGYKVSVSSFLEQHISQNCGCDWGWGVGWGDVNETSKIDC